MCEVLHKMEHLVRFSGQSVSGAPLLGAPRTPGAICQCSLPNKCCELPLFVALPTGKATRVGDVEVGGLVLLPGKVVPEGDARGSSGNLQY